MKFINKDGSEDKELTALKETEQAAYEAYKFETKRLEANGFHARQAQLLAETREPGMSAYLKWKAVGKAIEKLKEKRAQEAMANELGIPVQNPRTAALLGLRFPAPDEEYRRAYLSFAANGARTDFIRETEKHQANGHSYQAAWQIALTAEPGKTLFKKWQEAATAQKRISP